MPNPEPTNKPAPPAQKFQPLFLYHQLATHSQIEQVLCPGPPRAIGAMDNRPRSRCEANNNKLQIKQSCFGKLTADPEATGSREGGLVVVECFKRSKVLPIPTMQPGLIMKPDRLCSRAIQLRPCKLPGVDGLHPSSARPPP